MARIAAIFPNEGSQYVGMGKEFYAKSMTVRDVFDKAEKLLDVKLAKICFLGPKEDQDKLAHAHLITFVNEVAFFDPLVQNRRKPEVVLGIGVGEVAAMVAAECIPYPNALQYVYRRTRLLEEFAKKHGGASISISGATLEQLQPILNRGEEGEILITHYLAPDVFIIWGAADAIRQVEGELQGIKTIKTNPQQPRGPLFSPKAAELEPELDKLLTECLQNLPLKHPKITFHRSSDGEYIGTIEMVRDVLTKQYSKPLDWMATVKAINLRGFRVWVEVGPGKVYSSMVRKIDKNNMVTNVEDMKTLQAAVKATG